MENNNGNIVIPDPNLLTGSAIVDKAKTVAIGKSKTSGGRIFALAVLAGMFIGCGAMFMLLVKGGSEGMPFAATQVLGGLCFSLGLIAVIVAGAELFTGNCLMVCAVLNKELSQKELLKNWVIVWIGNLCGSLLLVIIIFLANSASLNGGAVGEAMVSVASSKVSLTPVEILFRGIMCNFLVCLAVWMGFTGKSVIDKIFTSIFPVMAFVACGFEHCVANMFFLPMGYVVQLAGLADGGITIVGILINIIVATIGNLIGGTIFIGLFYWIAYRRKEEKQPQKEED